MGWWFDSGYTINGVIMDLAMSKNSTYLIGPNAQTMDSYWTVFVNTQGLQRQVVIFIINEEIGDVVEYHNGEYGLIFRKDDGIYISSDYLSSWTRQYQSGTSDSYAASVSETGQYMFQQYMEEPLYYQVIMV